MVVVVLVEAGVPQVLLSTDDALAAVQRAEAACQEWGGTWGVGSTNQVDNGEDATVWLNDTDTISVLFTDGPEEDQAGIRHLLPVSDDEVYDPSPRNPSTCLHDGM